LCGKPDMRERTLAEEKEKSGTKDILLAMVLLLPVLPVIPLFLAGRWAGKLGQKPGEKEKRDSDIVWFFLIILCVLIIFFFPDLRVLPKVTNNPLWFGLIAAAGLVAGILYSRLRKSRWTAVMPLLVASFVCFMRFVMEVAAHQAG